MQRWPLSHATTPDEAVGRRMRQFACACLLLTIGRPLGGGRVPCTQMTKSVKRALAVGRLRPAWLTKLIITLRL